MGTYYFQEGSERDEFFKKYIEPHVFPGKMPSCYADQHGINKYEVSVADEWKYAPLFRALKEM